MEPTVAVVVTAPKALAFSAEHDHAVQPMRLLNSMYLILCQVDNWIMDSPKTRLIMGFICEARIERGVGLSLNQA